MTGLCVPGSSPEAPGGISADPAEDTVSYTSQEWLSSDGSLMHTIYGDGGETASNADTHEYAAYNPADNTLATLTDTGPASAPAPSGPPTSGTPSPQPSISDFADPSYYEDLYREARAGTQKLKLLGQTTIGGESVYELRFDITPTPPTNPPAGDICGATVCTPPGREILLYLDSQTFTPVRTVESILNTSGLPGIPAGTSVESVTDFAVRRLADTPANQSLLQMSPHAGATRLQKTEAQDRTELAAVLHAGIAAQLDRAGDEPAAAQAAARKHHRTPARP